MAALDSSLIYRPGRNELSLEHKVKHFRIIHKSAPRESSFGLFGGLARTAARPSRSRIEGDPRGESRGPFALPWPTVVGDDTHANAKVQVWIARGTALPVRVDLLGMDASGSAVLRFEDFRWGPQDPALFDTSPPPGYSKMPTTDVNADEVTQYVKDGLSIFAKYNNGKPRP